MMGHENDGLGFESCERLTLFPSSCFFPSQAGTYPSSAPTLDEPAPITLLVLACSRIPPSSTTISHSQILDKLRTRLESYASTGSYSIVRHPSSSHRPVSLCTDEKVVQHRSSSRIQLLILLRPLNSFPPTSRCLEKLERIFRNSG